VVVKVHLIWAGVVLALALLGSFVVLVLTGHATEAIQLGSGVLSLAVIVALFGWMFMD
jgi:hypothetical protein